MKKIIQIALLLGVIIGMPFIVILQKGNEEFPEIDHSSGYFYCVIDNAVYLDQSRLGSCIYITQNGLKHHLVGDWIELFRDQPDVEFLKEYNYSSSRRGNDLETLYRIKEKIKKVKSDYENCLNLRNPNIRIKVPVFENPYKWKPKEGYKSFEEYYYEMKSSDFKEALFRELQSWQSLWGIERAVDRSIKYQNKAGIETSGSSAPSRSIP